ncbi:MAG: hypothetical protein VKJ24_04195 [Synechococcales bacterium]|nr:hypothetical protein [Synechococcales bacterium]
MNLRFAIAAFVILFALAQLIQWLEHLVIPMPVYVLGGFLLAIISNHDKLPFDPLQDWFPRVRSTAVPPDPMRSSPMPPTATDQIENNP